MTFGERVRAARLDRDWTQEQLAEYAGTCREYVCRIERGMRPGLAVRGALARALDFDQTGVPLSARVADILASPEGRRELRRQGWREAEEPPVLLDRTGVREIVRLLATVGGQRV